MPYINQQGYLERVTHGGRKNPHSGSTTRAWWMVKSGSSKNSAKVYMKSGLGIAVPMEYIGKKVMFKMVVVE